MNKEEIERARFEEFLRVGQKSVDHFESAKAPEPDIIAYLGEEIVGVEITAFHRRKEKKLETEGDQLVDSAQQFYETLRLPCVDVCFEWVPNCALQRNTRERLAEKIARLVALHLPQLEADCELDWSDFDEELSGIIYSLHIIRNIRSQCSHWHAQRGGIVNEWSAGCLQQELDRKKLKPHGYLHKYSAIWLLLVSPLDAPSSWLDMADDVANRTYFTPYDRVFLLSSFPHRVYELKVSK